MSTEVLSPRSKPQIQAARRAERALPLLALLALFVAGANLRPAIAAVAPLVGRIRVDDGLSGVGVALLTTLPTLAMGLGAPAAASVGRRWGLQRGVAVGLAVIGIATAARIAGEAAWIQLSCAALAGFGIAIAQTLLPAVVKVRFSDRVSLATGVYTAGLGLGGAVAAGVSLPLANAFASWPAALACWALLAVIGIALWALAAGSLDLGSVSAPSGPATAGLPWRSATAWQITAIAAGNSALYYCELAWLVALLHQDSGYSHATAGLLLTVMISIQVAAMLVVPALLGDARDRRIGLTVTAAMTAVGFAGFALSPGSGAWVWLLLMAVGHGGLFPLVLALPTVASRDAAEASRISAMAFFVGYGCAAAAPVLVGALRDSQGNYHLAFALLAVAALAMIVPILRLSPQRLGRSR